MARSRYSTNDYRMNLFVCVCGGGGSGNRTQGLMQTSKSFTTELHPQPLNEFKFICFFEVGSQYVTQAGLQLFFFFW
jgi:hypothetical protein